MKYALTLILSDDRGSTKVKLEVEQSRLRADPMLATLVELHELTMPAAEPPAEELPRL